MIKEDKKFDAINVQLKGTNLIEASAGTGKTYSIAILVLRLILEKRIPIKEILMVTYTKAAVAELQERIRRFVRDAYKYSNGEEIADKTIMSIVDNFKVVNDESDEFSAKEYLRAAVLLLDETSVLTIHSFCQQSLTEFAFETKQIFGAEAQINFTAQINDEVNKFWRKYVTSIPAVILKPLLESGLSIKTLNELVTAHFGGKNFYSYSSDNDYYFSKTEYDRWENGLLEINKNRCEIISGVEEFFKSNKEDIRKRCESNKNAISSFLDRIDDPEDFVRVVQEKVKMPYVIKLFPDLIVFANEIQELDSAEEKIITDIKDRVFCLAISLVYEGVEVYKKQNNFYSFDDMILNLHAALMSEEKHKLITALQIKYQAVFVDEFQDTDKLQYEIFREAFMKNSIVFFIGDPKQSIYTFRNADINTYFDARNYVDNIYGMNTNFRSTDIYTKGLNSFFGIDDPFHFNGCKEELKYIPVEAPPEKAYKLLKHRANADKPFSLLKFKKKEDIFSAVAGLVNTLLDGDRYSICEDGNERPIVPSDIGILVRGKEDGKKIKSQIAAKGIPAVTVDEQKVLQTEQANFLYYLLLAMDNFSLQNINQALLNPITGICSSQLINLSEEKCVELFKQYRSKWDEDGLYSALMSFAADFDIRRRLANMRNEGGERMLTNFFQLIELLHKIQTGKNFSNAETINWLKRAIAGADIDGDEFAQRIESDEEAVNIVTIHKSKGLAYNIVILPGLDFKPFRKKGKLVDFRNDKGKYISKYENLLTEEEEDWFIEQEEQDNRRLIYVATTRAVFKCFIFKNNDSDTSITHFLNLPEEQMDKLEPSHFNNDFHYIKNKNNKPQVISVARNFKLHKNFWQRTSYSNLSAPHNINAKERKNRFSNEYDEFIFKNLAAGKHTGNMLHFIFENLHFSKPEKWEQTIVEAANKFYPGQDDLFYNNLNQLPEEVLNTGITDGQNSFLLKDVLFQKRIPEFEFDFPIPIINSSLLNNLSENDLLINVRTITELEGMMNGKIDLFFEHNEKFYVLDWKSNFLGDSIKDYAPEKLNDAMNENNYHLQYLIYTIAIIKFIKTRKKDFNYEKDFGGVIYLFVRGMRKEKLNGIFFTKPSEELINKLQDILE